LQVAVLTRLPSEALTAHKHMLMTLFSIRPPDKFESLKPQAY